MARSSILCLLLAAAPALLAQRPDFEVRVVDDAAGNALPSAEARLQLTGKRELSADLDTDREGIARASGLAPGEYALTVSKSNYVTTQLRVRIPSDRLTVRLAHFGIISGQVTDAKGHSVPGRIQAPYGRVIGGARIHILSKADGPGGMASFRELEVGEEGRYRVFDLPPGQYAVGLQYDGLPDGAGMTLFPDPVHPRWFTIGGGEEHTGVDFQVAPRPTVKVSGHVASANAKVVFALALGLPEQPLMPISQALTQDDGAFVFPRVPAGTYDLFVAGPDAGYGGHASLVGKDPRYARARINVGAADVTGIEIAPAGGKSVVVTLGSGKPPDGCPAAISVDVRPAEPWGIMLSSATHAVTFGKDTTITGLVPGKTSITVSGLTGNCYAANAPVIDLAGETPEPVKLELATAGSIHGLLRAPKPTEYTVVLVEPDAVDAETHIAAPDADGRFVFDSLKPGRYSIAARPAGDRTRWISDTSKMITIQIPGGSPTNLELPAPPKGDRP